MKTIVILVLLMHNLVIGCATTRESILLGAGMGAAVGGGAANLSTSHNMQATAIGALIGAGLGAAMGYLGHKDSQMKERQLKLMEEANANPKVPRLSRPSQKSLWVPDKIEGDKYIQGHRVFVIEDAGKWLSE